jgi:hypothetical protein
MSQFEIKLTYIQGEDNTAADALSRIPAGSFEGEGTSDISIASVLKIRVDDDLLHKIQAGYKNDTYCEELIKKRNMTPGLSESNGLWYISLRLLIPRVAGT